MMSHDVRNNLIKKNMLLGLYAALIGVIIVIFFASFIIATVIAWIIDDVESLEIFSAILFITFILLGAIVFAYVL
jgi:Co/Zn/Cd efflux system component